MESDSFSLTKGCFVHKPSKQRKKKQSDDHFSSDQEKNGHMLWCELDNKIKNIVERFYIGTFNEVLKFVKGCYNELSESCDEIPSAVLTMGVNMSDHSSIFQSLERHLNLNGVEQTVVLDSKKCTNFANMLFAIISCFASKNKEILDVEVDVPRKQDCSFAKLATCYKKVTDKNLSKCSKKLNPLVFLIQDVENFNVDLLQELILICKMYASQMPMVLIFGMASAMVSLHNVLPHKAMCCLGLEVFHSAPATQYLSHIIEEVVMSPEMHFKLGPRVFNLVVDTVLYHDFSVSNLSCLLKFSVLEHFYNRSITNLCCHPSAFEERVNSLKDCDLQEFKNLPSLKLYLENNPGIASSIKSTSFFKETLLQLLNKLFDDQVTTLVLLRILHCFVKDLPGAPMGKKLRELYSLSLENEMHTFASFAEARKLLNMQSQASLMKKLEESVLILEESQLQCASPCIDHAIDSFKIAAGKLNQLISCDYEKVPDPKSFESDKITSRFQLQEKIQKSIKHKRSNFDALRNEILEDVFQVFTNIRPPSRLPLYEIFYFDDVSSIKRHLMAVPRVTLCQALTNPHQYLKCKCCKISQPEETQATMPDICLAYKLHLESGKLINLCDWLEVGSFCSFDISNCSATHKNKKV